MRMAYVLPMAILAAAAAGMAAGETGGIVFKEAFDGAGDTPLGCTDACSISEYPPSLKRLSFRPPDNKIAEVYKGLFRLPKGTEACQDYELRFKFAFPRDSKRAFTLRLVSGDSANSKSQTADVITISAKSMGIRPAAQGLLPPFGGNDQELDIRFFPDGVWHDALARIRGRTMELFVENDGRMRKFAQAETAGAPLVGFNFAGSTAVDFDDIEIRRLGPLPAASFRDEDGAKVANTATERGMAIPADATCASALFRVGTYPGAMAIKLGYADGAERVLEVKTFAVKYAKSVQREVNELDKDGKLAAVSKTVKENVNLTDAGLNFKESARKDAKSCWSLTYNIRPKLQSRYEPDGELRIASNWESFPAASRKFVKFELRPDAQGAQLWLDGRYAGRFDSAAKITSVAFVLPADGAVKDETTSSKPLGGQFLVLDVSQIANPGAMADAKPSPAPGPRTIDGIPFLVADGPGNADTGVCRENLGSFALECDGYLDRSAFDGMPESLLLSVPCEQYVRAWALCAVEDAPGKVPVVTARLTRFDGISGARGPAIADTSIILPRPGEATPSGVKKIGEVTNGGKTVPLYRVEFPLDVGSIQDALFQEYDNSGTNLPYRKTLSAGIHLDFELLGKRNDKDNFYINRERKPSDDISGVHVFAATLERSPVELRLMPARISNTYQPGEQPGMKASLRALQKADCKLEWAIADSDGKRLGQGSRDFSFANPGATDEFLVSFEQKDFGWYSVDFTFSEKSGRFLLAHRAYFALIDKDARKAGYESPYLAWWPWGHGMADDKEVVAETFSRAGIRRSTHNIKSEKDMLPRKFTLGQFSWFRSKSTDPEKCEKELAEHIKTQRQLFPHANEALIFHESGNGPYPLELLGGKTEIDAEEAKKDKAMAERAENYAKVWRKHAPDVKLVVGNSGDSLGLMARLFRAKYPKGLIDAIGEESVGMTMAPERNIPANYWALRRLASLHGYDLPVEACYEWKCRVPRHLGLRRCAEWSVRDALIALAWGNHVIPLLSINEPANSYYNTVWGSGGFTRYPQFYPYPSYPAIATLTAALDRATFTRMIPTGSPTVYALEFKRGDEFVYVLWTARGELDATLVYEKDAVVKLTELLGRSSETKIVDGKLTARVGEGAVYLTSPAALKAVAALGERSFPRERPPAGARIIVASPMDKAGDWKLDMSVDPRIDVPAKAPVKNTSFRRPGAYELRPVKDEQKGDCLELELVKKGDCPALMQEYARLTLTNAVALPGEPATVGLWVKGNSSWGKIFWEIEDAEGEKWLSAGTGGYGCDVYDWPDQAGINFDGWHFLQFPITGKSPITVQAPGQDGGQWRHDGTGNRGIDYPIKLTGFAVSMPRQTVNLLDMEPVKTVVRLKDLSAY